MTTGEFIGAGAATGIAKRTDAEHRDFARQLAAEKARLLAAQAVAKVGSWENEIAISSITWSDETHRIFGTTAATFTPTHEGFLALVHPEDRAKVEKALTESLGKSGTHSIEHRILLSSGVIKFVEERWTWTIDEQGAPIRALGTCQDITDRTLAERALRDSEQRFASAFDDAPIGMALVSLEGRFLMVNEALCEMLGYAKLDLLTSSVQDVTLPDDASATKHQIESAARNGVRAFQLRKRYKHALGHPITATVTSTVARDRAGNPRYFIAQVQDFTERERNEEAKRLQAQMLDNVGQAVIATDAEGHITYMNRFAERLYGWPTAEVLGKTIIDVMAPAESGEREAHILATLRREGRWSGEINAEHRAGTKFVVSATASPVYGKSGELLGMVGISEDITARTESVLALRASEEKFRTLAESMPQIVWITTPDGANVYFNQQWMDYTGLTLEESLGDGWIKPFHPDDRQRAWDAWQTATASIGVYSLECRLRRADGEYRWWLVRGVPRKDAEGKILEWFGTCTDIHEFKQADVQTERTNRAFKLIIEAGAAVIQMRNEAELLAEICRIAVEVGGYEMGWIGFALDDEAKSIVPMAHAGVEDGYLAESTVTWNANDPTGQGPAGRAIRTGEVVVSGGFGDDPSLAPWQKAASRLGYAGAIALPLRNAQRTYGVLALYCAEVGPATEEELALLEKFANGVAYGINNLRSRA